MIDKRNYHSSSRKEALSNEVKGALFEFLVAMRASRQISQEVSFIDSLSAKKVETLKSYENWYKSHNPEFLNFLVERAKSLSEILIQAYPDTQKVKLIARDLQNDFGEGDILLSSKEEDYPVSLKLLKEGAYINTKSAGVSSFLKRYFGPFKRAQTFQEELDLEIQVGFREMCLELHEYYDLTPSENFGEDWKEEGPGSLPTDLEDEAKEILYRYYKKMRDKLFSSLEAFHRENGDEFKNCLLPVLGFSDKSLIQHTCYYKEHEGQFTSRFYGHLASDFKDKMDNLSIVKSEDSKSAFEISSKDFRLQIRVKPMNTFTQPSYKINCSLKYC